MQIPGRAHRADHVVAALHDHRRNTLETVGVGQQLIVAIEESAIDEVVAFDAGEGQRKQICCRGLDMALILEQETGTGFPHRPCPCCGQLHGRIGRGQTSMVGTHQIAAFDLGNGCEIVIPRVGEQGVGALLVKPLQLPAAQHEDATQYQFGHAIRMALGIGQGQRGAPGAPEDLPALDAQMFAQALDIGDQMPGGVGDQAGVRRGTTTTALVEEHDAVLGRVEEAPRLGIAAGTGTAVQENHWFAFGVAALLEVELVTVTHRQASGFKGLDLRVQLSALHGVLRLAFQKRKRRLGLAVAVQDLSLLVGAERFELSTPTTPL